MIKFSDRIFVSKGVQPINDIENGVILGKYNNAKYYFKDRFVLPIINEKKDIYLYVLPEKRNNDEVIQYLRTQGLKFCVNSPNYFLGLMSVYTRGTFTEEFLSYGCREIVAGGGENNALVRGDGQKFFLMCDLLGKNRDIRLQSVSFNRPGGPGYRTRTTILAEQI